MANMDCFNTENKRYAMATLLEEFNQNLNSLEWDTDCGDFMGWNEEHGNLYLILTFRDEQILMSINVFEGMTHPARINYIYTYDDYCVEYQTRCLNEMERFIKMDELERRRYDRGDCSCLLDKCECPVCEQCAERNPACGFNLLLNPEKYGNWCLDCCEDEEED